MFNTLDNLLVAISGALETTGSHFFCKKCVLKNVLGYLRIAEYYSFQTFAIVFSTTENLLVGYSPYVELKESYFICKNVFWENAVGYLRNSKC